jgi:hypothetical protein
MRQAVVAALLVATFFSSSIALADGPAKTKKAKSGKKAAPAHVATVAPLPPLPPAVSVAAAEPLPAPVPVSLVVVHADQGVAARPRDARPSAGPGFVLEMGTGVSFLGGSVAQGMGVGAGLATVDLKIGAYLSNHVGVMAGVQGGYGGMFSGCAGSCSDAYAYEFPVTLQIALRDRSRGLYFEGGAALVTTYGGSTNPEEDGDESPESLQMRSPADLRLGIGYRFAGSSAETSAATSGVELRFGADIGEFKSIDYASLAGSVHGDVASTKQAIHVAAGLSLGYVFTP